MQRYGQIWQTMGVFPYLWPQDFFQKLGSASFVPLWCPISMQKKLEKLMNTDRQTSRLTERDDYIGPIWISWGPKSHSSLRKIHEKKTVKAKNDFCKCYQNYRGFFKMVIWLSMICFKYHFLWFNILRVTIEGRLDVFMTCTIDNLKIT